MKKFIILLFLFVSFSVFSQSSLSIDEYNDLYKFMPITVKAYERIIENNAASDDDIIIIDYKRRWLLFWINELYFNDVSYGNKISAIANQLNTIMMIYKSTKNIEETGKDILVLDEYASKNQLYYNIQIQGNSGIYDVIKKVINENIVNKNNFKKIYEVMIGWESHVIINEEVIQ